MFRKILYRFNNELTKEQQIEVLESWNGVKAVVRTMDGIIISDIHWRRGIGKFTYDDAYVSSYKIVIIDDKYRIIEC